MRAAVGRLPAGPVLPAAGLLWGRPGAQSGLQVALAPLFGLCMPLGTLRVKLDLLCLPLLLLLTGTANELQSCLFPVDVAAHSGCKYMAARLLNRQDL